MNTRNARNPSTSRVARLALLLALSAGGQAMAQTEPTLDQVYQEAQAGRVEHALQLMQPVLRAHPGSAKAHYVEAELLARQGSASKAREELGVADRLAPGLPFAKPESVQSLRRELASPDGVARSSFASSIGRAPAAPGSSIPWGVLLAVGGGGLVAWLLTRLGRPAAGPGLAVPCAYAAQSPAPAWAPAGMSAAGGIPVSAAAPGLASPGGGLGSQVAGGLATGLAVGAGVMAAEAIGKSLFGGQQHAAGMQGLPAETRSDPMVVNTAANPDLGGRDFGVNDAGSWDDAGGGGSDWDS